MAMKRVVVAAAGLFQRKLFLQRFVLKKRDGNEVAFLFYGGLFAFQ